ncbi:MAG: hypothetical protein ACJAYC_001424 [Halieaceae bacterium]|jgi:hypothetical protein
MQTITAQHITSFSAQPYRPRPCKDSGYVMDALSLAHLNFGLFGTLCKLGTSRERICSALNISYRDFDYLQQLTLTQRQELSGRN